MKLPSLDLLKYVQFSAFLVGFLWGEKWKGTKSYTQIKKIQVYMTSKMDHVTSTLSCAILDWKGCPWRLPMGNLQETWSSKFIMRGIHLGVFQS